MKILVLSTRDVSVFVSKLYISSRVIILLIFSERIFEKIHLLQNRI